jgi:hypothetical protein
MTTTLLAYLKAIAAVLATIIGWGVLRGNWLGDAHLILALVNGVVVALTPNVGYRPRHVVRRPSSQQP